MLRLWLSDAGFRSPGESAFGALDPLMALPLPIAANEAPVEGRRTSFRQPLKRYTPRYEASALADQDAGRQQALEGLLGVEVA
jgi:hypothetical protein